ncbi:MAG: alpha/beta fold hydrolase [Ruminococcaceae bacterium]|nr:alpha/beta fold hydrolase [Oscillospiraceae bacterium]
MLKFFKILLIVLLVLVVLIFAVVLPILSISVYKSVFNVRFETSPDNYFTADDYEGLTVENVLFKTKQGHNLAGYKYRMDDVDSPKGVVVYVHGFGGGGHCGHMPMIHYLAENGYAVFAYDATGNDASEGKYIGGFPQGIIDLDYAIRYVKNDAAYSGLPIFLMGHSWGAYSVGNVLNFHTDVKGAVLFAGIDSSSVLFRQEGAKYAGDWAELLIPYVRVYERIKYGEYSMTTANKGFASAENAEILVVHSKDDDTVLQENGYDLFMAEHGDNERVHFVLYDDRGHNYLFYSEDTMIERQLIDIDYDFYLMDNNLERNDETRAAFRKEFVDYSVYYKMDDELMGQAVAMFDRQLGK